MRHHAEPPQAEQERAALRLGVDGVAQPAERRLEQRPPAFARVLDSAASRTARSSVSAVPSMTLRNTLPVKPSVTTTSASPVPTANPSTLPANANSAVPSSAACAATTSSVPFVGSVPLERSATRGRVMPMTISMNAAPMWANWTRCSGRTSTFAPQSSSRNGRPGTGTSTASAGRWTPRARFT